MLAVYDCFDCKDQDLLGSEHFIEDALLPLAIAAGIVPYSEKPQVTTRPLEGYYGGVLGVARGGSGYVAVTTYPEGRAAWVEVSRPMTFEHAHVAAAVVELLEAGHVDYQVILRGYNVLEPRGVVPAAPWLRISAPPPEPAA